MSGNLPSSLMREGFAVLASVGGPFVLSLLLVGLLVGLLQAATQINDPAVGFLPRFAAAILAVWLLGGWVLERYGNFFASSLARMSER